jgi:ESS family glutamate:Na+ symporter
LFLVVISAAVMVAQNLLGVTVARLGGLPPATGLLAGTVSLVGGHGTTIAWAETFREVGIDEAKEIGIAAATIGLVLASASGGPIARFLIGRHHLRTPGTGDAAAIGVSGSAAGQAEPTHRPAEEHGTAIDSLDFLGAVLAIHICIIFGSILQELIQDLGLFLPLFVPCLVVGVLISNLLHRKETPGPLHWPCRTPALALVADISLGAFLAMSLMSLQLWTLVDLAGPLLLILLAQFVMAIALTLLLVFPLLGGDYDAAVLATGFCGIVLGSTPTAMANMTAVTERFGPSYRAFILLPLLSAFFIDLLNAVLIPAFLGRFS